MQLKSFNEFLNEKEESPHTNYFKKVNFLLTGQSSNSLAGLNSLYYELNDKCLGEVFGTFFTNIDEADKKPITPKQKSYLLSLKIDPNKPTVYYGGSQPAAQLLLKNNNILEERMYNTPSQMELSCDKSKFYKLFEDSKFIPKAAYNVDDAATLKFPVIGKPDKGHSGSNIEIFETEKDLRNSKSKFANFSEAKDLDREYRVMVLKGNIISIYERVSKKGDPIKDKKRDEYVDFAYVKQDLSKLDFLNGLNNIIKEIRTKVKLGVWSVDLMIEKNNDLWVAEINSASGLTADRIAEVYCAVYEDFYDERLPKEVREYLHKSYTVPVNKINVLKNGEYIKKSKGRSNEYSSILND
jgi:hypothetical protein